jgi:hypothetical protein
MIYNIEDLTDYTPDSVGESDNWAAIVSTAERMEQITARV